MNDIQSKRWDSARTNSSVWLLIILPVPIKKKEKISHFYILFHNSNIFISFFVCVRVYGFFYPFFTSLDPFFSPSLPHSTVASSQWLRIIHFCGSLFIAKKNQVCRNKNLKAYEICRKRLRIINKQKVLLRFFFLSFLSRILVTFIAFSFSNPFFISTTRRKYELRRINVRENCPAGAIKIEYEDKFSTLIFIKKRVFFFRPKFG